MRPMKSRAWDKKTNSYVEAGFDFRIDGSGYIYRRVWGESQWERTSDLEIEYSTGRKDKNGKEIYKGDKIIVPAHYKGDYWQKKEEIIVEWDDSDCPDGPGFWLSSGSVCWKDCEVIGNIHDNGNLLNDQNK